MFQKIAARVRTIGHGAARIIKVLVTRLPDQLEEPARRVAGVLTRVAAALTVVVDVGLVVTNLLTGDERLIAVGVVTVAGAVIAALNDVQAELTRSKVYAPATVANADREAGLGDLHA